jgi:hypothetical protein
MPQTMASVNEAFSPCWSTKGCGGPQPPPVKQDPGLLLQDPDLNSHHVLTRCLSNFALAATSRTPRTDRAARGSGSARAGELAAAGSPPCDDSRSCDSTRRAIGLASACRPADAAPASPRHTPDALARSRGLPSGVWPGNTGFEATPLVSVTLVLRAIAPLTSLGDRGSIGRSIAPTVPVSVPGELRGPCQTSRSAWTPPTRPSIGN